VINDGLKNWTSLLPGGFERTFQLRDQQRISRVAGRKMASQAGEQK
jgi:hypothetical protein